MAKTEILTKNEAKGTLVTLETLRDDPKAIKNLPFEEIAATLAAQGDLIDAEEQYGDGAVLFRKDDKRKLVGIPMILFDWGFSEGVGASGEKVTLRLKLTDGTVAIINDGSAGIYRQIKALAEGGLDGRALMLKHGLRASDYTTTINGKETEATTYYLADLPIPRSAN
jgi:hypothetical protein